MITDDRRRYVVAGLRQFAKLSVGAAIMVVAVSLVMGLLFGHPVVRSITLGFYLTGSAVVILGFFHAHRGPLRPQQEDPTRAPFDRGPVRQATLDEAGGAERVRPVRQPRHRAVPDRDRDRQHLAPAAREPAHIRRQAVPCTLIPCTT